MNVYMYFKMFNMRFDWRIRNVCDGLNVHECDNCNYVLIKWDALCGREWAVYDERSEHWKESMGMNNNELRCIFQLFFFFLVLLIVMNQTIGNDKIKINEVLWSVTLPFEFN